MFSPIRMNGPHAPAPRMNPSKRARVKYGAAAMPIHTSATATARMTSAWIQVNRCSDGARDMAADCTLAREVPEGYYGAHSMDDPFGARSVLQVGDRRYEIFRLEALSRAGLPVANLPYSMRILLENLLR